MAGLSSLLLNFFTEYHCLTSTISSETPNSPTSIATPCIEFLVEPEEDIENGNVDNGGGDNGAVMMQICQQSM